MAGILPIVVVLAVCKVLATGLVKAGQKKSRRVTSLFNESALEWPKVDSKQ